MTEFKDVVITGSLTVKHPDAKHGLIIQSDKTGAGIWIGGQVFVAIHSISGQICMALGSLLDKQGHAFAIGINENTGEPFIQLCRPGKECRFLSGEALDKLFDNASPELPKE